MKIGSVQKSIDGWNRIGFWLLATVGSSIIVAILALVIRPNT